MRTALGSVRPTAVADVRRKVSEDSVTGGLTAHELDRLLAAGEQHARARWRC
jgi:hypothetical protein